MRDEEVIDSELRLLAASGLPAAHRGHPDPLAAGTRRPTGNITCGALREPVPSVPVATGADQNTGPCVDYRRRSLTRPSPRRAPAGA